MRSVVVVLPASMCAAMPMLRVRSRVYSRLGELADFVLSATASILNPIIKMPPGLAAFGATFNYILPAEMCKRLVGLGHFVHLVALANRVPLPLIRLQNFRRQRFAHGRAFASVGKIHNPPQGQRGLPV